MQSMICLIIVAFISSESLFQEAVFLLIETIFIPFVQYGLENWKTNTVYNTVILIIRYSEFHFHWILISKRSLHWTLANWNNYHTAISYSRDLMKNRWFVKIKYLYRTRNLQYLIFSGSTHQPNQPELVLNEYRWNQSI